MDPMSFDFSLTEFDLSLLTADPEMLKGDETMPSSRIEKHLRRVFEPLPGETRITRHEDHMSVRWIPRSTQDLDSLVDLGIGLIRQRSFPQAETILRTLLSECPDHRRALLNLGSMLCEQGRLQEAREALRRLTRTAPDFAYGWHALGVVLSREGKRKGALSAFRKSLVLDPQNGHALRSLGALMERKDPQEALRYLKRAAKLLPSDQPAQYLYGKCLMACGSPAADSVLKKASALKEDSEIADLCRDGRLKIARRKLKPLVPRGLRMDVVVFCVAALETFKELGRERTRAAAFEIASLGNRGLNIKDRTSRWRLLSLPGQFSALQLIVYLYVALKKAAPGTDAGIDFSKEYAFALSRLPGKKGKSRHGQSRQKRIETS